MDAATALIVVDVQRAFEDAEYWGRRNNPACEANVAALIEEWRAQGRPVVYVRHDSDEDGSPLRPDEPGNALRPELTGEPDLLVAKHVNSSFHGEPDLDALAARARRRLVRAVRDHHQPLRRDDGARGRQPRLRRAVRPRRLPHVRPRGPRRHAGDRGRAHARDGASLHGEFATVVKTAELLSG